ncbi:hypothetical protein BUALT_Bualt17G0107700 [Buddleja alternifolia]|uniref:Uncharacterized protein n=1 Tax=Buddleja alternifolia TaxID=168488 RepID=A0AAV6WD35_9LAMI|nr:hypothetical protein BUALT_Bualt17G0107700 [Buddleja alternifolia]
MSRRIPYPPCAYQNCKYEYTVKWPDLVGLRASICRTIIEQDNPFVTVVNVPPGGTIDGNFCCNRVYLFLDDKNVCKFPPTVG